MKLNPANTLYNPSRGGGKMQKLENYHLMRDYERLADVIDTAVLLIDEE